MYCNIPQSISYFSFQIYKFVHKANVIKQTDLLVRNNFASFEYTYLLRKRRKQQEIASHRVRKIYVNSISLYVFKTIYDR